MVGDAELLSAWRDGDTTAGRQLFERHIPAVSRFFRNKVGEEREDLTQQTFLACLEGRDRIRDGSSFRAYLLRIARNQLYDHFSSQARRADPLTSSVLDLGMTPSAVLGARQRDGLLLSALQQLPLELQTCLELHYWEGLRLTEIAEITGVAPGTAKSRMFRARELLRELLLRSLKPDPQRARLETLGADEQDRLFETWATELRDAMSGVAQSFSSP